MTPASSRIAVIILNYNGIQFLEKFLPTVIAHSYPYEVIVADNCSTDDSINWLKSHYPQLPLIEIPVNMGYAGGYNFALKQCHTEYALLLNNDVQTIAGWLEPLIQHMDANPKTGACQPKLLDFNNPTQYEYAGAAGGFIDYLGYPFCKGRIFNTLETDQAAYSRDSEIFWASGAAMCVSMEAFRKVEGFDESFFAHMEEIDLCWRMKNLGYKIMCIPSSAVYHVGGGTLSISPKKTYLNFRNNLSALVKNDKSSTLWPKVAYRLILDGIAGLKFLIEGQPLHCLAVIRAHFSFYKRLNQLLKKRNMMRKKDNFKHSKSCIYHRAIIWSYFIQRKKKFSDLGWNTNKL